jgi:hypothetical protein
MQRYQGDLSVDMPLCHLYAAIEPCTARLRRCAQRQHSLALQAPSLVQAHRPSL